ncbi:MAG: nucleotide sugar dehydrogenase, partial [Kiloniellales bacterium]
MTPADDARETSPGPAAALLAAIDGGSARLGVIGLGYVGLPLARAFAGARFPVTGFDIDPAKIVRLNQGRSYFRHIPDREIASLLECGRFAATGDYARLADCDVILICVPTPLAANREPDLSYVERTAEAIARHLRPGQLVVLESTTYPGTTRGVLRPILERSGLEAGRDFFLAFAPEREDPGNRTYGTVDMPKVVGADDADSLALVRRLYDRVMAATIPVRDSATAEATKLTENVFRAVNIALANELKVIYDAMGIDVWEVIEAAKTKPFGYMPFYPGPGLGGHCIPIDPFYLAWKAKQSGIATRFIELAGEINRAMPAYVVARLASALMERSGRALDGATVLVLGLAYKKNVDDLRESPALTLIELLESKGAAT